MRIALVTHNIVRGDGQGRVNYEIVRHLSALGVRFLLIADRVAPELLGTNVEWMPLRPLVQRPNLFKCWHFARLADRAIDKIRRESDLIVANGFVLRQPHDVNISHFVHSAWLGSTAHVSKTSRGPNSWYQWSYSSANCVWERQAYQAAHRVVGVSGAVRDDLARIGIPSDRITVIENGVDTDEFTPGREDRRELGLPMGVVLGIFAGDLRTKRKNLDGVLKAMVRVPEAHLAVAGKVEGSPFPTMVRALGLQKRVTFLGFRKDIARLLRAADFFIFPSRYEACPLVVLEALACGLPVITAATVGGSNIVVPECGHVIEDPDDLPALIRAIQHVIDDDAFRHSASLAARTVAEGQSWAKMAAGYLNLFNNFAAASCGVGSEPVLQTCC